MDKTEALTLLHRHLDRLESAGHRALSGRIGENEAVEDTGESGAAYQLELTILLDDRQSGAIRILGSIDDGGLRAFFPLSESRLVEAPGAVRTVAPHGELAKPDPKTKSELLDAMISARTVYDSLLRQIPRSRMTLPGAAGSWSVKDLIAHVNAYDRWLALGLALRSQKPPDGWIEDVPLDDFNQRLYEESRDLPLDEILEQSAGLWKQILEETRAHPEAYLFSEHVVPGVPDAVIPWEMLKSESYGHYLDHVPALRAWLAANE